MPGGGRAAGEPADSRGGESRALTSPQRPAAHPALDPAAPSFPTARRTRRPGRRRAGVDPPPPQCPRRSADTDPPRSARAVSASAAQIRLAGSAGAAGRQPWLAVASPAVGAGDGRASRRLAAGTSAAASALPDAGGRTAARARSAPMRSGARSGATLAAGRVAGTPLADRSGATRRHPATAAFRARLNVNAEPRRNNYDIRLICACLLQSPSAPQWRKELGRRRRRFAHPAPSAVAVLVDLDDVSFRIMEEARVGCVWTAPLVQGLVE